MRTLFRNVSANRYAFDVKLLTIASIMHLKVQEEMPAIMKIDRIFNIKEIVKVVVDVARISYKYIGSLVTISVNIWRIVRI
jgi:hypothetical protein